MSRKLALELEEVAFRFNDTDGARLAATITSKLRSVSCGYAGVGSHGNNVPALKLIHFPETWRKSIAKKRLPPELLRSNPTKNFKGNGTVIRESFDNHFGEGKGRKIPLEMPAFAWMFFLFADFVPFPYKRMLSGKIRDFEDYSLNCENIFNHLDSYPNIQEIDWGYSAQLRTPPKATQPEAEGQTVAETEKPAPKVTTNLTTIAWLMQRAEAIRAKK